MTKKELVKVFGRAYDDKAEYVAIKISTVGMESEEIIINKYTNMDLKLEYYLKAYDDNLFLKTFNGIKIIDAVYGDSLQEIEDKFNY